ncbi:hypothetical protein VNI00_007586 [Paramarasmius palmivorus]|uniref:WD40 repeat domain-containing protein n=1 Tax=Paramarasmius palmivorus TaxID=297713 RepID=A0AAW0D3B9_9AGAR
MLLQPLILPITLLASRAAAQSLFPASEAQVSLDRDAIPPVHDRAKATSETLLPGHPKKKEDEVGCIRLPMESGIYGPCSNITSEPGTYPREAGTLSISPDGTLLAIAQKSGSTIFIYETETLKLRQRFNSGPGDTVRRILFPSRNKLVLFSSFSLVKDREIMRVFDLDEQLEMRPKKIQARDAALEAFTSILGKYMPSTKEAIPPTELGLLLTDLFLHVGATEDMARNRLFDSYFMESRSECTKSASRDGRYVVRPGGSAVINIEEPGPRHKPWDSSWPTSVTLFTNSTQPNRSFLAAMADKLEIWDLKTETMVNAISLPEDPPAAYLDYRCPVFSPDGKLAILNTTSRDAAPYHVVWHIEDGTVTPLESSQPHEARRISFSNDGKRLFVQREWSVGVYNTSTGDLVYEWKAPYNALNRGIAYRLSRIADMDHTSTGLVVCRFEDGNIALLDPETRREGWLPSLWPWNYSEKHDVVLSPDGSTLYSSDSDGNVRLWSLRL